MQSSLKPRDNPNTIDCHRSDHMVQVRFRLPQIACLAQFKGPNTLGQGAFNPGPSIIVPLPLRGLLALAGLLQMFVFRLGAHGQRA